MGTDGIITTVAGNGETGYFGDGIPATSATLNHLQNVRMDDAGNLFILDGNPGISTPFDGSKARKVIAQGPAFTIANAGTINQGHYDVTVANAFGSVTSSVVVLSLALPPLRAATAGDGSLTVRLAGAAGQNYILQAVASLNPPINWQPIYTNAADANGNWSFTNVNLFGQSVMFYRATVP